MSLDTPGNCLRMHPPTDPRRSQKYGDAARPCVEETVAYSVPSLDVIHPRYSVQNQRTGIISPSTTAGHCLLLYQWPEKVPLVLAAKVTPER